MVGTAKKNGTVQGPIRMNFDSEYGYISFSDVTWFVYNDTFVYFAVRLEYPQ